MQLILFVLIQSHLIVLILYNRDFACGHVSNAAATIVLRMENRCSDIFIESDRAITLPWSRPLLEAYFDGRVVRVFERYVRHCGLRPALTFEWHRNWKDSRIELVFQDARADLMSFGLSLFGALTVQLMSAATGSAIAICSACGHSFVPRRRPAFGKRRYCRACGRAAAVRDAVTDFRTRQRLKHQPASRHSYAKRVRARTSGKLRTTRRVTR